MSLLPLFSVYHFFLCLGILFSASFTKGKEVYQRQPIVIFRRNELSFFTGQAFYGSSLSAKNCKITSALTVNSLYKKRLSHHDTA